MSMSHYHIRQALAALESFGAEILNIKEGLIRCPGEHLHTTPNGARDCKVLASAGGPVLKCFHCSCCLEIERWNQQLRGKDALFHRLFGPTVAGGTASSVPTPRINRLRINKLIADYPLTASAIMANSPVPCSRLPIHYHAPALLSLFGRQDIIWIGRDLSDTGRPAHKWRFREAAKWIGRGGAPGVYVCPSTFHPLSYSRSVRNVKERRFLVVESDVLTRDEVGSVFQWMRAEHYRLRAVVDTAGKSLHGWFDFPAEIQLPRLKTDLIELGCDPAMFGASQPCRLPGALRNGRFQKLLYIDA